MGFLLHGKIFMHSEYGVKYSKAVDDSRSLSLIHKLKAVPIGLSVHLSFGNFNPSYRGMFIAFYSKKKNGLILRIFRLLKITYMHNVQKRITTQIHELSC